MSATSKHVCNMPPGCESLLRGINSMNWRSLTLMYETETLPLSVNEKASSITQRFVECLRFLKVVHPQSYMSNARQVRRLRTGTLYREQPKDSDCDQASPINDRELFAQKHRQCSAPIRNRKKAYTNATHAG